MIEKLLASNLGLTGAQAVHKFSDRKCDLAAHFMSVRGTSLTETKGLFV